MYDQRTNRSKYISKLDAAKTRKIMKRDQRKQIQENHRQSLLAARVSRVTEAYLHPPTTCCSQLARYVVVYVVLLWTSDSACVIRRNGSGPISWAALVTHLSPFNCSINQLVLLPAALTLCVR